MAYADPALLEALKRAFNHHWHLELAEGLRQWTDWNAAVNHWSPSTLLGALADALATGRADELFHENALEDVEDRIEYVLVACGYKMPNPTEEA